MHYFLLLLTAWLLALPARATPPSPTDTAAQRINRLPASGGLLLKKGWRYHAGDDPAWARPDFDDRAWDTLTPPGPGASCRGPRKPASAGCGCASASATACAGTTCW